MLKFDFVAGEDINQEKMFFEVAKSIADFCIEGKPGISFSTNLFSIGYNGTIFAYGQTGAGKTYTIQGPGFETDTDAVIEDSE